MVIFCGSNLHNFQGWTLLDTAYIFCLSRSISMWWLANFFSIQNILNICVSFFAILTIFNRFQHFSKFFFHFSDHYLHISADFFINFSCLITNFSWLFTYFRWLFTNFSCLITNFSSLITIFSCLLTNFSCLFTIFSWFFFTNFSCLFTFSFLFKNFCCFQFPIYKGSISSTKFSCL